MKYQATIDFDAYLFNAVSSFEGVRRVPYDASDGDITIGIGFDLTTGDPTLVTAVLQSLGLKVEPGQGTTRILETESAYISRVRAAIAGGSSQIPTLHQIMAERAIEALGDPEYTAYLGNIPRPRFEFSAGNTGLTEMNAAFAIGVKPYIDKVYKKLGWKADTQADGFANSKEKAALVSLAYNGFGAWPSALTSAVKTGNHPEAWFLIRYKSNYLYPVRAGLKVPNQKEQILMDGNVDRGWAKRRYAESAMFGLYDSPDAVSGSEAKAVYQVLQQNRALVWGYERTYGSPIQGGVASQGNQLSAATTAYASFVEVQGLEDSLTPAKNALLQDLRNQYMSYADQLTVNSFSAFNIYVAAQAQYRPSADNVVGQRLDSAQYEQGIYSNGANDLMLGSAGADTIIGNKGDDVLIGDLGADILRAGSGNDLLLGGGGDDTLEGGVGEDVYGIESNSGDDVILDSDGKGTVKALGQGLAGGTAAQYSLVDGKAVWTDARGTVYSFRDTGDTVVDLQISEGNLGDGTITIRNFDLEQSANGGFLGISLKREAKAALTNSDGRNPFTTEGGSVPQLAPTINERGGSSITMYLSQAAKAGDTITINMSGGSSGLLQLVTGAETLDLSTPVILNLSEGQTELTFALVSSADITSTQSIQLHGEWSSGDQIVQTNSVSVTVVDSGEIGRIYIGDQRPKIIGIEIDLDKGPADLLYNTYKWSSAHWANDGVLTDGLAEPDFNDVIYGQLGNDAIFGLGGNDALSGGSGADSIDGGSGDDLIGGGAGADIIYGGDGNDVIEAGNNLSAEQRNSPNDLWVQPINTIVFSSSSTWGAYWNPSKTLFYVVGTSLGERYGDGDFADGGNGDDWINGGRGNDRLLGGVGNDILQGLDGDDILEGGVGDDAMQGDGPTQLGFFNTTPGANHGDDFLDGGEGNDRLWGQGGNDQLFGGDGRDSLYGDDDPDRLAIGYAGDDYLDGESGDDVLSGGAGDDVLLGGDGNDALFGDAGNDYIDGQAGDDAIKAGDGNDVVLGGTGRDQMFAGDGDDYLDGGDGADELSGDRGDDTLVGGDGNDRIDAGAGQNQVFGEGGDDFCQGGEGDDQISGGTGADQLFGESGTDHLEGGDQNDLILGGAGDDTLIGDSGSDVLEGGTGSDYLSGGVGDDSLSGGIGDDTLDGGEGRTEYIFNLGDGQDIVLSNAADGAGESDIISMGYGIAPSNIQLTVVDQSAISGSFALKVEITGSSDNIIVQNAVSFDNLGRPSVNGFIFSFSDGTIWSGDTLNAHVSAPVEESVELNSISGTLYADDIVGEVDIANAIDGLDGNDTISGGAGRDEIDGGSGQDLMIGHGGNDLYTVDDSDDQIIEIAAGGEDSVQSSVDWVLSDYVENLELLGEQSLVGTGNSLSNIIRGNRGNNYLYGGAGDDTLEGLAGVDVLDGGDGDDYLSGGEGDGLLTGGEGNDVLVGTGGLLGGGGNDRISGSGSLFGDDGDDTITGSGYIDGGNGEDVLISTNDSSATIYGGAGADRIFGSKVNDRLEGGAGSDVIDGYAGDDHIIGGVGDDVISGGLGDDFISGDDGADQIDGAEGSDFIFGGNGIDFIKAGSGDDDVSGDAGDDVIDGDLGNDRLNGGDGVDQLFGGAGDDTLSGGDGDDNLFGAEGDDRLFGGDGKDQLDGFDGNNYLEGGSGDDVLTAHGGADSLYGGSGDDNLESGSGNDMLSGGEGNDILSGGDGNDILLGEDGSNTLFGGDGADTLIGTFSGNEAQQLWGGIGADLLIVGGAGGGAAYGGDGNDNIIGSQGNDILVGGEGADQLDGQSGADVLDGGLGGDTYNFSSGTGTDTILDSDDTEDNFDILSFADGISKEQIWFRQVGSDLEVSLIGTLDSFKITDWFEGAAYHLELFTTADGRTLVDSQVAALVSAMAAFAPPALGETNLSASYQQALAPVIAANWT